jgi:adenylate cyclase
VVVVTIDQESSARFGLPNNPRKWPRDLHGRLVDRLKQAGASVIAFDVMFQEPRDPAGDKVFASALRRAGNVVLFEYLKKEILPTGSESGAELIIEQRIPPVTVLADAALAIAPFALPKVPVKVSQVWLFKPEAGDAPTLPMVALGPHTNACTES